MEELPDPLPSVVIEQIRNDLSKTRSRLDEFRRTHCLQPETLEAVSGLLTCGIATLYDAMQKIIEFEIRFNDNKFGPSLPFYPRGIGNDLVPCCYVCKKTESLYSNIAAFVNSKEDGEKIVEWFGGLARLDFRSYEPNWIQVKVGTCEEHLPNLKLLGELTSKHGRIRECDISNSIQLKE